MGRPRGSKNRKKTDTSGDADDKQPSNGHNSSLTDDERRALTLHHKRQYEAAEAVVERAKAERKAVADLAKSELGKGAVGDIKDMIVYADHDKARAMLERTTRLAKWMGMPVGFQVDLFADRAPVEEKWAQEGFTAGLAGDTCQPPVTMPPSGAQIWISQWHRGQAILTSAFAKVRVDHPAQHAAADTSEQPF
jgi:hypothetical protein